MINESVAKNFPRREDSVETDERDSQSASYSQLPSIQSSFVDTSDTGFFAHGGSKSMKSKNITLDLLIQDGILEPADRSLAVKYLGRMLTADLLERGKIRCNETGQIYNTPSSWAISCKKRINPAKTSGCGWSSIRYKGKSLDLYKSKWMKYKMGSSNGSPLSLTPLNSSRVSTPKLEISSLFASSRSSPYTDVKPANPTDLLYPAMSSLPLMDYEKNISTQVRCEGEEFSMRAFFTRSACLAMGDLSLRSTEEVSGYLAGLYDSLTNVLTIQKVFNKSDAEAKQKVRASGMTLVGWFHSHPKLSYYPSVYDVECQMNYQLRLRDQPIVSCIIGKRDMSDDTSYSMLCYTVSPPKLKFSERFGCLSDKCGKPKSVNWTLERSATPPIAQKSLEVFMNNISKEVPS
ncbi:MPN domain-containing protein-like isoform X2 [Watersipora subatra]|uniref:MPN domain-containing protein-like isoform X2 n=1 Tax=Watersipora subatra TaxID=2589382 RepID=UPI00355BB45C